MGAVLIRWSSGHKDTCDCVGERVEREEEAQGSELSRVAESGRWRAWGYVRPGRCQSEVGRALREKGALQPSGFQGRSPPVPDAAWRSQDT